MGLTKKQLEVENAVLKMGIKDIWWMARRYAHGRRTYAVGSYNDTIRSFQKMGMVFENDPLDDTIWAKDGDLGFPRAGVPNG